MQLNNTVYSNTARMILLKVSKNLDTDLKIILLDHQNKHVERLSVDDKHSSNQFEYQNYFDASSKKKCSRKEQKCRKK